MSKYTTKYYVDLGVLGEIEFKVEYQYSPGYADTRWEPGEPASIEINSVSAIEPEHGLLCGYVEEYLNGDGNQEFADQNWPDIEADRADHYYQEMKDRNYESQSHV